MMVLIFDVARGNLIPSLTYASPAWWMFASAGDKSILQAVLNNALRWGLCDGKRPLELAKICRGTNDVKLFKDGIKYSNHVMHEMLPPKKMHGYNLVTRPHQHVLPIKNLYAKKNSGKNAVGYNLCILS